MYLQEHASAGRLQDLYKIRHNKTNQVTHNNTLNSNPARTIPPKGQMKALLSLLRRAVIGQAPRFASAVGDFTATVDFRTGHQNRTSKRFAGIGRESSVVSSSVKMDSFVCKLIVLENKNLRVLKPKKIDNTDNLPRPSRETTLKKCLFGVSSPADTEKMVQEQYEKDRRRFSERFGIDLDELENLERDSNNENDSGNAAPKERSCGKSRRRILKGKRKTFDERGQLAMTGSAGSLLVLDYKYVLTHSGHMLHAIVSQQMDTLNRYPTRRLVGTDDHLKVPKHHLLSGIREIWREVAEDLFQPAKRDLLISFVEDENNLASEMLYFYQSRKSLQPSTDKAKDSKEN